MAENKIQMPGQFAGLMRYDEEYKSRFMITATQVMIFVGIIVAFVLLMKLFFPVAPATSSALGAAPVGNGLIVSLLGI